MYHLGVTWNSLSHPRVRWRINEQVLHVLVMSKCNLGFLEVVMRKEVIWTNVLTEDET